MEEVKNNHEKRGNDDYTRTALFTAGTALVAVCLKRAIVVFFTLRQWHLWAFLLLNLLLLAILFTSAISAPSRPSQGSESDSGTSIRKAGRKRKNIRCGSTQPPMPSNYEEDGMKNDCGVVIDSPRAKPMEECGLSDEELNERVESFIASFRRQLVMDARR